MGSQAISYTTGVPAMCGALMLLTGKWNKPGVYTVEEFDPDPFLDALDQDVYKRQLLALALGLYKLQLGESAVNMAVTGVYVITCLVGGILAGKVSGQHKFLWGLATGVLYFLILLAASFFLNGGLEADVKELLTVLGMCAGSGTIGGMVS